MNNTENLVLDESTENVEQPTTEEIVEQVAEPEKIYSKDEFQTELQNKLNEIIPRNKARVKEKVSKQYDAEYGELVNVLRAGTNNPNASVKELAEAFKDYYQTNGVTIPQNQTYTSKENEILAQAEANEIISLGFDEVVEEANRLNNLGVQNMSDRDKALFVALTKHIKNTEVSRELKSIGVTEEVMNSESFKNFASKFSPQVPIKEVYNLYSKSQPQEKIQTMGSMKQSHQDSKVKDYYSPEEIERLTEEDLKDPKVWEAVRRSMTGG